MVNKLGSVGAVLLFLAIGPAQTEAFIETFQQNGYTGTQDTFIEEDDTGADNSGSSDIQVVNDSFEFAPVEKQGLLRFDNLFVSQGGPICDGATITSATLRLWHSDLSPETFSIHDVLLPDPAWADTLNWGTSEGGDGYQVGAEATAAVATFIPNAGTFIDIDVTTSLQAWSDTADTTDSNFGWVFMQPTATEGAESWRFRSSEYTTATETPKLTVDEPSSFVLTGVAIAILSCFAAGRRLRHECHPEFS